LNLARRHLTDAQKAMLGRQIEPDVASVRGARQLAALRRGAVVGSPSSSSDDDGGDRPRNTDAEVAGRVGMNESTYRRHRRVIDLAEREAPDLMPHVESGEITITNPHMMPT